MWSHLILPKFSGISEERTALISGLESKFRMHIRVMSLLSGPEEECRGILRKFNKLHCTT
jgi:hypothetical protein